MQLFDYEKKHVELLRKSLAECTVLLKKNGTFPLEKPCHIAAYGNGVRGTLKGGTGSGEVNSRYYITVEQGLLDAGFTLSSTDWLDSYERVYASAKKQFVKEVKKKAKEEHVMAVLYGMGKIMPEPDYNIPLSFDSDAAIYVLSRICGEGNDRSPISGDLKLTQTEINNILTLNKKYQRFMLVLNVGGPIDLSPVNEVGNILILSQLGVETGAVLADILLGHANPSGKLTTTWSSWEDYCPDIDFGDLDDTRYRESIYVGYRYFDTVGKKAAYPFGFGLSYGEFVIRFKEVTVQGDKITITSMVTNTGKFAGKETVQVYVSAPVGELDKPYQELAGFGKTNLLEAGQEELITITFQLRDLASFHEKKECYVLEAGKYIVRLGNSSTSTEVIAVVTLDSTVITKKVHRIFSEVDFKDLSYTGAKHEEETSRVPILKISGSEIETEVIHYDKRIEILPETAKLTDEELIKLNMGAFQENAGALSVIGNASLHVAGAAGESYGTNDIPAIVMADGPAGLRLTKEYYKDEKGIHAIGESGIPESLLDYFPAPLKIVLRLFGGGKKKAPAGKAIAYQYTTAIPIGTAIAQSFNLDFAEECGNIVGTEMERFGIHLWLAPALNIHRCILCGRNFEYYSEDPLLSGKFAAAMTRGVQKHLGCGTTIKHYAANNQETNRMNNNSIISERAMREIYLKGFEICIKESNPCAVMTSYNLINGEHVAESQGLIEDFLRKENGFQGIVITDWIVQGSSAIKNPKYRGTEAKFVAKAGGNIFMPGSSKDYENLVEGLQMNIVSKEQLQKNASYVIQMVRKLHGV